MVDSSIYILEPNLGSTYLEVESKLDFGKLHLDINRT
jgi:hypothetical protein